MAGGTSGGVTFTHEGAHLRVDARPARLVSMLKPGDGAPVVTAQPASGDARSQELPGGIRQATFQIRDDITVEATPAATFVAVAEDAGRCLVIAYGGEITVVPGGDDRFALAADEALVIGAAGGEPSVVPVAELSAASHPEIASLLDATAQAVFDPPAATAPGDAAADAPVTEERTVGVAPTEDKPAASGGAKKAAASTKAGSTPAKAAGTAKAAAGTPGGGRRKKGKKGRPQPQKAGGAKKAATAGVAAGAAAGGAAAAGAAGGAKKAAAKATGGGGKQPPKDPPKGGGGGGGGGHDDDSYEDTPRDKRFLVGAVLVALVLAVGAVLLLSNVGDDSTEVATDETTTTEGESPDTTTSSTTPPSTTAAPAPTTTAARATTTTAAAPPTTAARATTTTAAPQPRYSIEPKSCVQNGNTITYTASVKNDASTPYDFTVDVSFKTSDGSEVAKATANVTRLAPGRTADFSATGTSSRNLAGTGASCDVTRVAANPSA